MNLTSHTDGTVCVDDSYISYTPIAPELPLDIILDTKTTIHNFLENHISHGDSTLQKYIDFIETANIIHKRLIIAKELYDRYLNKANQDILIINAFLDYISSLNDIPRDMSKLIDGLGKVCISHLPNSKDINDMLRVKHIYIFERKAYMDHILSCSGILSCEAPLND